MLKLALAVALATVVSAGCSVAEAVLYSLSWSYIERLRNENPKVGNLLFRLRSNIDQPITAILTLNTAAHTVGAALAGAAAADVFGVDNLLYFSIVFTLVILLFSEILPKTIGVAYNRQMAPVIARSLNFLIIVFYPAIWLSKFAIDLVQGKKNGPAASEEDLLAQISLSRKAGAIEPHEALSMQNILALDKRIVREIMTPRMVIFSLPSHYSVLQAKESKTVWPHSRIPVYEGSDPEDIVGIVYRREVLEALAGDKDDLQLESLMKPVKFVVETLTLDRLLVQFLESRMHLVVVLDEFGGLAGVVSLEDVLEEILGNEIVDETDQVVDMRELARKRKEEAVQKQQTRFKNLRKNDE